jgi:hypothetical protein
MTRRVAGVLAVAIAAFFAWTGAALAQNRLALVIGNSAYHTVSALPNPINDAQLVTQLLQEASFEVTVASDLGLTDMRRTVDDFAAMVAAKGPDAIVLVFYAGHGLQLEGENFLVPIDAKIEREADVAGETLRLVDIVRSFESARVRMLIVMLDACRNNPFAAVKGAGRGLATVDAPTGSLVAYSTAPGAEAEDGTGVNSPYTSAFVEVAKEPGLQIEQLFKRVRLRVHKSTDRRQTPWESSSLTGDFTFFSSAARVSAPPPAAPPPAVADVPPRPRPPGGDVAPRVRPASPPPVAFPPPPPQPLVQPEPPPQGELPPPAFAEVAPPPRPMRIWADELRALTPDEAYDLAIEEDRPEVYEEFVNLYPTHPHAGFLRRSLTRRVEAIAWRNAAVVNTPEAYRTYLAAYPGGKNATEALRLRERPRVRPVDPVFVPRVASRPPGIPQGLILPGRPVVPVVAPGLVRPAPGAVVPAPAQPAALPVAPVQPPRPAALPLPAPVQPVRPGQLPRPAALPPAGGVRPGQVRPVPGQPRPGNVPAAAVPPGQLRPGVPPAVRPGQVRPGAPAAAVPPGQVRPGVPPAVRPGQVRPGVVTPSQVRPTAPGQVVRPTVPAQPTRPIAVAPPGQAPRPQVVPGQITRPGIPPQVRPAVPPQVRPAQIPAQVRPPSVPTVRPPPQVRPAAVPAARPAAPAKPAQKCTTVNGKQVCTR